MDSINLDQNLLQAAKPAFSCRRVDLSHARMLLTGSHRPQPGDVLLAKVQAIGQHQQIELASGRRAQLFPGDTIILAYGNRYAPDQFHGLVPRDLRDCAMLAAGGLAGQEYTRHASMADPTLIRPLGLLANAQGQRLSLGDFAMPVPVRTGGQPPLYLVVGSAMNAGKTTTAAHLIRGLVAAGYRVGAAKLTGTAAGGDLWLMRDAGARYTLDFTDTGLASTYGCGLSTLLRSSESLLQSLARSDVDVLVAEVADGLAQIETRALLASRRLRRRANGLLFAAGDALGAAAGIRRLRAQGWNPTAVSGCLTQSPLAVREASNLTGLPVLGAAQLVRPDYLHSLLPGLRQPRPAYVSDGKITQLLTAA